MAIDRKREALELHRKHHGKLAIASKVPLNTKEDLSLAYTPGVAEPCLEIAKDRAKVYEYTIKGNSVAVVTDGTAVLGLGDIGPEAGLPVMEGKAILFKEFAGIDAFPICLATRDTEEIIATVKRIAPSFGGINLEDIAAPKCFEIEERLRAELDIPVMHDDQHGTAVVVLAALTNALKVVGKRLEDVSIVLSGAGAAGIAVATMLRDAGAKDLALCDRVGVLRRGRPENMNRYKAVFAIDTEKRTLADALRDADVFIGLSSGGLVSEDMVRSMAKDAIVFAMANPEPEILPEAAKRGGAKVVATGRSDFENQVNNVLAFPGIFRGALDAKARITDKMLLAAAMALAGLVKTPSENYIIPDVLDRRVAPAVADAVMRAAAK